MNCFYVHREQQSSFYGPVGHIGVPDNLHEVPERLLRGCAMVYCKSVILMLGRRVAWTESGVVIIPRWGGVGRSRAIWQ